MIPLSSRCFPRRRGVGNSCVYLSLSLSLSLNICKAHSLGCDEENLSLFLSSLFFRVYVSFSLSLALAVSVYRARREDTTRKKSALSSCLRGNWCECLGFMYNPKLNNHSTRKSSTRRRRTTNDPTRKTPRFCEKIAREEEEEEEEQKI